MIVKLIRHGESVFNKKGIIQGHTNSPLTETGIEQAKLTGLWLKENAKITRIYTSPLKRALQTAEVIAQILGVELILTEEFKEICLGEWEGKSIEEIKEKDWGNLRLWYTEPLKARIPKAENLIEFRDRVINTFLKIIEKEKEGEIAIVSHGGVISVIIAYILNLDMNHIWRMKLNNASISEVTFGYMVPKLTLLNSTLHLNSLSDTGVSIWNPKTPP